MRRRNPLHYRGANEAADHETEDVKLQVVGCILGGDAGFNVLCKANDEAGNTNLSSYVKKLGEDAADEMVMRKNFAPSQGDVTGVGGILFFSHGGQMSEIDEHGNGEKDSGDHQIGHSHGADLSRAVGL